MIRLLAVPMRIERCGIFYHGTRNPNSQQEENKVIRELISLSEANSNLNPDGFAYYRIQNAHPMAHHWLFIILLVVFSFACFWGIPHVQGCYWFRIWWKPLRRPGVRIPQPQTKFRPEDGVWSGSRASIRADSLPLQCSVWSASPGSIRVYIIV